MNYMALATNKRLHKDCKTMFAKIIQEEAQLNEILAEGLEVAAARL